MLAADRQGLRGIFSHVNGLWVSFPRARPYPWPHGRTERRNAISPPRPGAQAFSYGGRQFYRYRASPYAYPHGFYGWAHHDWRRGEWLPSVFIAENYFINDWYDFGLYEPEYGYEWIRVGADALLIDVSTGAVMDVVPGVYYW